MFGLFSSDPIKKLEKLYAAKLKEAIELQRKGDIVGFSHRSAEADDLLKQIDQAEAKRDGREVS